MPAPRSVVYGPDQAGPGPEDGSARRVLAVAALGPIVTGYLGIAAAIGLITANAPGGTFSPSGVLAAAGPAWLAGYHVPITIAGHDLGVLPLLPTALLLLLVARAAGTAADRLGLAGPRAAVRVLGPVAATHAVSGMVIALLCASSVSAVTASPALAFVLPGALSALAATAGVARSCGLLPAALSRADHTVRTGLRAGVLATLGLAAAGAVVFAAGLIASWPTAVALYRSAAPGFGSGLGMLLLSVAYLPNVLVGTLSFPAGPGFGIGALTVAQWQFHAGGVPAIPVLAPVPAVEGHWWVFLMLLPAGAGVLTGLACRGCRDVEDRLLFRLRAVALAGLVAAVSWLVLAALAGGSLAAGPFDPVVVPAGSLGASVFLIITIPAGLTVWLAKDDVTEEPDEEELEPE